MTRSQERRRPSKRRSRLPSPLFLGVGGTNHEHHAAIVWETHLPRCVPTTGEPPVACRCVATPMRFDRPASTSLRDAPRDPIRLLRKGAEPSVRRASRPGSRGTISSIPERVDPNRAVAMAREPTRSERVRSFSSSKTEGTLLRFPGVLHRTRKERKKRGDEGVERTLRQTCSRPKPRAPYALGYSMVREILQFTLRIAVCCVLHRCESQDIRC
mmetsp:Transcript_10509/g.64361  ORF Transcript_10509/g.64361 Transcript_10509/m.64361 type:complete len:214 (-) Transcript_10509:4521-5162(-)